MKIRTGVSFLILLSLTTPLTGAVESPGTGDTVCQYLHVTDPCQNDLLIFDVGEPYLTHNIPLHLGLAGAFEPGGVDFAEVPDYRDQYSFVTQGPYLRVIKHELAAVWRTIDVELGLGISGLRLNKVYASGPVTIGGNTVYPLYLTGYRLTDGSFEPIYIVLDQQALLAYYFDYDAIGIAWGSVCVDGIPCVGVGLDISAGTALDNGPLQQAFVTVLNYEGSVRYQRIYRLTLAANGSYGVSIDPWNEEGLPFAGTAHRSIGLDFDRTGLVPFGLFQTTAVESNLLTGEASCALPGGPTDVEIWGPGSGGNHDFYHFVTARDNGVDLLLGYATGECPGSPGTLTLPVGAYPRAVGISSDTSNHLWVYTANKNHGITAVELQFSGNGPDLLQLLDVPFPGCPADIAFRDEAITVCNAFEDQPDGAFPQSPGVDDPDDPCPPNSTDPECIDPGGPSGPQDVCESGMCGIPGPKGR